MSHKYVRRNALEIVTGRLSAAEVTIRGLKELHSHESCLTTQPLPVGYTNRQVNADQFLFR